MGNPYFAISPLKKIIESQHDLVAVISNPPKPMGRKKVLKYTDVGKFALDNNIKMNVSLAKESSIGVDTEEDFVAIKKIMEYKSK